jgi:hypothetical protein
LVALHRRTGGFRAGDARNDFADDEAGVNFLLVPYISAIVLFVTELRGNLATWSVRLTVRSPWLPVAALTLSYAAQLAIVRYAAITAAHDVEIVRRGIALPLPVVYPGFAHQELCSIAFLLLAAIQTLFLVVLYRCKISTPVLVFGTASTLVLSLCAPALTSFDLYGYVHDAILGRAAYAPPSVAFTGEYRVFDAWFGKPSPTLYGPLWIPVVQLVTAVPATLLGKMLALRFFSAALALAFLALMRAVGHPVRILAVIGINPAFAFLTVANAHNDLLVIAIVAGAALLMRARPPIALGLLVVAGLIKLPYALLGLPVIAYLRSPAQRIAGCVAVPVATVVLSWLGGGGLYESTLARYAGRFDEALVAHGAVVVAAIAVIASTQIASRRFRTAVWLMPSLGSFRLPLVFPWYTLFGVPYAMPRRNVMRYLFVSLPFVSALVTPEFATLWTFFLIIPAATVLSIRWAGRGGLLTHPNSSRSAIF